MVSCWLCSHWSRDLSGATEQHTVTGNRADSLTKSNKLCPSPSTCTSHNKHSLSLSSWLILRLVRLSVSQMREQGQFFTWISSDRRWLSPVSTRVTPYCYLISMMLSSRDNRCGSIDCSLLLQTVVNYLHTATTSRCIQVTKDSDCHSTST